MNGVILRGYILTLVSATLTQVQKQIFFSAYSTTPNLFMLASCLAYRVNIYTFYMYLGVEKHPRTIILFIILNVVIMQNV